jgi:hypothetical protein
VASPTMVNAETKLVQVPVIYRDGDIIVDKSEFYDKPDKDLQIIAKALKGEVRYVWKRVMYTELVERLCTHYNCSRPVSTGDGKYNCGDHK